MTITTSTLRPGFLVSLKTSVRGGVQYAREDLGGEGNTKVWKTERTIDDPEEHERARKQRAKASQAVSRVCSKSAFGYLCPEVDKEKLEAGMAEAQKIVAEFNESSSTTSIGVYVLLGRVMPDDVEAVRSINSEIRELLAEMSTGVENGNTAAIREAASRVKGIGEMLSTEAQTKVEMAVKTARDAAKAIVRERDREGTQGTVFVDKSAIKRINELRTAFLDLDDNEAEVSAPKVATAPALDLAS
jgi:hypothetical protein